MQEQILGDYRILKQIGQGTLGIVLLAEHRFIKKHFILKVLPSELSQDRNFVQRFEEEVVKLASLDHPHIVKIHNVSFAEGFYFLVTDCIVDSLGETTNLAQYMAGRKERLREDELLSVMRQIADALDYAHSKEISHRALKLNNILIGKGNPGVEVFISDFGLANIISSGAVVGRTFKTMAEALGTLPVSGTTKGGDDRYSPLPIEIEKMTKLTQSFLQGYAFLAPEQKTLKPVDSAADIYAFGVLAYYLIAGHFPEGSFEMPSELAPEYSSNWDHLVTVCLSPSIEKRPSELLPLLEKKKITGRILLRSQDDLKREENESIESLKAALIQNTPLTPEVEAPVYAYATSEVQETVSKTLQQNKIHFEEEIREETQIDHIEIEQHILKPIINPSSQKPSPIVESQKPTMVEKKDISEASPMILSPPEEENFTQILNTMLNRDPVVTQYQPEKEETKYIEPLQTEMVIIKGGYFLRGSNEGNRDEMPHHKIYVDSFAVDIHPVTNEQFVRFLEYMGGEKDQNYNDLIRLKDSRVNRIGGKLSIESGYMKHPVVGVTWYGAVAYAKWVGKRLPTEAEWEIAVRAGMEHSRYSTGDNIEKSQANFFSSDTTAVMSYAPNRYGLYDMIGNVYEWCQDWYGYNYYETSAQEPTNPKGPLQGVYRVLRGGCWKSLKEDLRCSHRHRNNPGTVNSTYGFRCAADVQ